MDAVDAIDSGTEITLGLRQRLQTKRRRDGGQWRSVNWAELDVALVGRSSDSVNTTLDNSFLRADFEMLLSEHVTLHSRDNRIALEGQPDLFNVGASVDYMPKWAFDVDFDSISGTNSTLTFDVICQLSDRYQLAFFEQYELDSRGAGDQQNLETRIVLRRFLHEWILEGGLHFEKANDDLAVIFGFGPAGWGIYRDPRRAGR
jgi:hypothetical protein